MGFGVTEEEAITEDMATVYPAGTGPGTGRRRFPLENPGIDPIPHDPLREPHPDEPGVGPDGEAAPLENPDDRFSSDPLR